MLTRTDEFLLRIFKPKYVPYLFWTGIILFFGALAWFLVVEAPDQAEHNAALGLKALVLVPIAAVLCAAVVIATVRRRRRINRLGITGSARVLAVEVTARPDGQHDVALLLRLSDVGMETEPCTYRIFCVSRREADLIRVGDTRQVRLMHGDDSVVLMDRLASKGPLLECRRSEDLLDPDDFRV
jgi:hypothetical protein